MIKGPGAPRRVLKTYTIDIHRRWVFKGFKWQVWSGPGEYADLLAHGKSASLDQAQRSAEFAARNLDNPPWNRPPQHWSYQYDLPEDMG